MTTLIASDLHITDSHWDSYRWGIFAWLAKMARKHSVDQILLLGDLTMTKDRHSSALTNRLVDELAEMTKSVEMGVFLLAGNHDYVDPQTPFFRFLSHIPNLKMCRMVTSAELFISKHAAECIFIPSTHNWPNSWSRVVNVAKHHQVDYIFCHQTFTGAVAENGQQLQDVPISTFDGVKADIYSGDVHVPQVVGPVTYVGAPYRIKFGDRFDGRVLLIDEKGKRRNLRYPCPNRHLLEGKSVEDIKATIAFGHVKQGDQVKIEVTLQRAEYPSWPAIKDELRRLCEKAEYEVAGIAMKRAEDNKRKGVRRVLARSPEKLVDRYCDQHEIADEVRDIGKSLLKGEG